MRPALPPTIIFHGDKDTTVPYATVLHYTKLAKAAGNECELATYQDYGHGFFNPGRNEGNPGEAYRLTVHRLHEFLQSLGYLENDPQRSRSQNRKTFIFAVTSITRGASSNRTRRELSRSLADRSHEMGDHGSQRHGPEVPAAAFSRYRIHFRQRRNRVNLFHDRRIPFESRRIDSPSPTCCLLNSRSTTTKMPCTRGAIASAGWRESFARREHRIRRSTLS